MFWKVSVPLLTLLVVAPSEAEPQFFRACASGYDGTATAKLLFLFFELSSATSSDCVCAVTSTENYTLTAVWREDDTSINVTSTATEDGGTKACALTNVSASCSFPGKDRNLMMVLNSTAGSDDDTKKRMLVVAEGSGNISIHCPSQTKDSTSSTAIGETATYPTTPVTTEPKTLASTTDQADTATPPSSERDLSTSQDSVPNSTTLTSQPTEGSTDESPKPSVTGSTTPVSGGQADTTALGSTGSIAPAVDSAKAPRGDSDESEGSDSGGKISMMSLIVLVVGVVLIVIAGIVIAGFVVRSRRGRQHHKQLDRGEEGAVQRKDKRNGHKVDTIRDSLLDRHNYEEVSEDGLSGPDSKSLHSKQQPNYSHMPDKGHSRQASGASSPHAAEQQRLEDADEDNYNKLNLQASARSQGAQAAPRPKPQPATNAAEDDDYMEIGGDDIYEAVDDDGTPLCPRRKRRSQSPREDYTDCVSSNDLADKGGSASTHVVFLGKQQQQPADVAPKASSSSPGSRKEQNKPDPPRSAPPSHVRHSKSAEDLAADRPEVTKPPSKHKQSNSVDLRKMQSDYQNAPFFTPGAQQTNPNAAASPGPPARDATTRKPFTTTKSLTDLNAHSDEPPYSNTRVPEADLRRQQPSGTTAASDSNPDSDDPSHVVLRPKSRAPKPSTEGPSLLDHLKDTNPGLLAFQESMRSSMEINDEELVMIDNVLYGTLPRDLSLPTTEL